jgi:hypothetical protein
MKHPVHARLSNATSNSTVHQAARLHTASILKAIYLNFIHRLGILTQLRNVNAFN